MPLRCPSCRPFASKVRRPDGSRIGFEPEAIYVGFLKTDAFEGYKRAPEQCPTCGATLIEVRRTG